MGRIIKVCPQFVEFAVTVGATLYDLGIASTINKTGRPYFRQSLAKVSILNNCRISKHNLRKANILALKLFWDDLYRSSQK
jgi:hypothetical protein